jgi:hypothetical protein
MKKRKKIMFDDSYSSNILGVGDVLIRFIFGREVTLNYMLHAPEIHKNLIYGYFF